MTSRTIVWGTFVVVLAAATAGGAWIARRGDLPFYDSPDFTPHWRSVGHRVAPFAMTSQSGESFTDRDLDGRVYVASFLYTRCSAICPRIVGNLQQLQAVFSDPDIMLLSFSVTPDLDTPEKLAEYAREWRIDSSRWKLLTGSRSDIYGLARNSFFADDPRASAGDDGFLHTEKLLLVDGRGRLRGIYNGTLRAEIEHLVGDIRRLTGAKVVGG